MGVSGSGKTLVGSLLAERLDIPFYDGDDYHPKSNIDKMRNGIPLSDSDRRQWLCALAHLIGEAAISTGAVIACSALKEKYRQILALAADISFVYLKGDYDLIMGRLLRRTGHFMPPELLQSQFDALEEPLKALTLQVNMSPDEIVGRIIQDLISESTSVCNAEKRADFSQN